MPWYRIGEPGADTVAMVTVCRRGGSPLQCVAPRFEQDKPDWGEKCGRMSVALCDARAGETLGGKPLTCDAPMCEQHRTSIAPNVDHCPRHAKAQR